MTVVTVSSEAGISADTGTPDVDTSAANTRHARALAALRSAEVRTGVRKQATATRHVQAVRAERLSEQVRALPGGLADGTTAGPAADARVLPVHPRLAGLLPDGGLRAGTTVVVQGSTSLLLTLLAEASRDGAWTVLVGYPAAGMAAAADAGCDLARTLVVPLPAGSGVDAPAVLAALIDGMDVVVVGPEVELLDQDRRRLTTRARDRGTVLVAAPPALSSSAGSLRRPSAGRRASTQREGWAGAHVVLEAVEGAWAGIDQGTGWLRRRTLRVRRTGRGSASRPLHLDVEVPVCRAASGAGAELVGGPEVVGGADPVAEQSSVVEEAGAPSGAAESRPQLELVG
jgi:hypothetical protein